ncbi:CAZyme family CE2 [Aspergillus niger]|nr:CAZyme family CE2 [Aspergillus niger]KAI2964574.1 CAZyme family CE2 [Aspergillus niger]KAI3036804.1 CAZyme family CE2 [Aspergillus niger]KAI3082976.1 CAZyme family CE2 [Aspergillus niger]
MRTTRMGMRSWSFKQLSKLTSIARTNLWQAFGATNGSIDLTLLIDEERWIRSRSLLSSKSHARKLSFPTAYLRRSRPLFPTDSRVTQPERSNRKMRLSPIYALSWALQASATILQNGQVREDPYPGQAKAISLDNGSWRTYQPDASEIAYKGRWDSKHVSWWSLPGIKLGFTGEQLAVSFGPQTSEGVLLAYRIDGLDWQFSNVTANSTYQFAGSWTPGLDLSKNNTFEMRVQLAGVSVASDSQLVTVPQYNKTVEIIGDSFASGQYGTYEGLSSWAYNYAAGLGDVEYSITAYPGICLTDEQCYADKARGMTHQWFYASDAGVRANATYGNQPEKWDFSAHRAADLVIIDLGTNDHRAVNDIPGSTFYDSYVELVTSVHETWPDAQIVIMSLWGNFTRSGDTYVQSPFYVSEIQRVAEHFQDDGFVYYFDTKGVLQHNDIDPQEHPTDVGHIKVASHLMQWTKLKLGWEFGATGPEVQHDTLYWNNEDSYRRSFTGSY